MSQSLIEELKLIIKAEAEEAKATLENLEKSLEDLKVSTGRTAKETDSFESSQKKAEVTNRSFASSIALTISKLVALGLAAREAYGFLKESVQDAEKENQALAALQATLSATGRTAEISVGRIDKIASEMEDSFNADKQAIMDASAELAIMEGISSSLFERIILSSTNLSYILGTDVGSSISTLGRALEDPLEGMTKLERQGIFIKDGIRKQIEELVNQNRTYEAQVLLLDEIDSKVSGTAEKIAEVSSLQALSTSFGKMKGSLGQILDDYVNPILGGFTSLFNYIDSQNSITIMATNLRKLSADDVSAMDIGQLQDLISTAEELKALGAPENSQVGRSIDNWERLSSLAYERLAILQKAYEKEVVTSELEKKRAKAEEDRLKVLEEEKLLTETIAADYASTEEGHKAGIEKKLEEYRTLMDEDRAKLDSDLDADVKAVISPRIAMYESLIQKLEGELDALAVKKVDMVKETLGMSAEDYVLNIPLGFDFGRTELETVEAQLSVLKSTINTLYSNKPEEGVEEWQKALDVLKDKYDELLTKQKGIKAESSKQAEAEKELADLKARSEQELLLLLSDEELAKRNLGEYEALLLQMLDNKLISQEEFNRLLEQEKETLGLSGKELSSWEKQVAVLKDEFVSFLQMQFSSEALASDMSGLFSTWGDAIASGEDAGDAMMSALGDWTQQLTSQLSSMFISAGLRVIIEGGYAGLPLGLALIAAGGLTGFASGLMGGSGPALSEEVMQSMNEEMDAREKLARTINESIDQEYELLRRQLDRNLIGEEEFIDKAGELQAERNEADARADISNALFNRITSLNNEYASMSGWDRFWSGRDEDIEEELEKLQALFESVGSATTEELRELIDKLQSLGINTSGIPKFASGGDFITNGPQLILVGDNPGGRERVKITPISRDHEELAVQGGNIYIIGDVYGLEDLNEKLKLIDQKDRRRRI